MSKLTANEVESFYDYVRSAYKGGDILRVVKDICEGTILSRVKGEVFTHAKQTVDEFKSNADEPVGRVYVLFGEAAAIKYTVLEQLQFIAEDENDEGSLGWLNRLAGRSLEIDPEDMEMFLHHSEKDN